VEEEVSSDSVMNNKFIEKFIDVSVKISEQIHLRAMQSAFVVLMPLFILAGLAVLINFVFFPVIASGDTLSMLQGWGEAITNGTLNLSALAVATLIGYFLAENREFRDPLAAATVAMACFVMMLPLGVEQVIDGQSMTLGGMVSYNMLGTGGMIGGIVVGLLATELFIGISKSKALKINLGDGVPSGVSRSFEALLPMMFTCMLMVSVSLVLKVTTGRDLLAVIFLLIQTPLAAVNNSLPGFLLLTSLASLLFTLGIHHNVITASFIGPIVTINMNENALAFMAGQEPPHIITATFREVFMVMGGTGMTISLLVAAFIAGNKQSKTISRLSLGPAIFNINEPVIFGFPIVFNLPMMIPFVLFPMLSGLLAYTATAMGLVNKTVVMVPWTTPPIISGFMATAGDWRASVLQLVILAMGVVIFMPFMKMSESIAAKQALSDTANLAGDGEFAT
jgi:cellobiose PTS system EIIC component